MHIVYIEDDMAVYNVTMCFLRMLYPESTIDGYNDIEDACALQEDKKITVMITDCNLPSGNVCDRECFKNCTHIPVVLVTGDTNVECERANCITCCKPYTMLELRTAINKLLR